MSCSVARASNGLFLPLPIDAWLLHRHRCGCLRAVSVRSWRLAVIASKQRPRRLPAPDRHPYLCKRFDGALRECLKSLGPANTNNTRRPRHAPGGDNSRAVARSTAELPHRSRRLAGSESCAYGWPRCALDPLRIARRLCGGVKLPGCRILARVVGSGSSAVFNVSELLPELVT